MQKTFESLKDNDIEIIVIAYLLKHPDLIDTHFEHLDKSLFANAENLKIYNVLEDFYRSQKNVSVDLIKNYIPDIQSKTHKDLSFQIDQIVFSNEVFLNTQQLLFCHGWSEDAKSLFSVIFHRTDLKISLYG